MLFSNSCVNRLKRDIECTLGVGGIHGCNPGIYEEDDVYTILTYDVTSYYPSYVISSKIYPAPLGKEFIKSYAGIKEKRLQYPKSHPLNKAYKDCLNSLVGYSKSVFSDIYDYKFFYSVTVNGQLILINLIEELQDKYSDVYPIMVNTDGAELVIRKSEYEDIIKAIEDFGKRFGLSFECSLYHRIIVKNVNNYIAISRTPAKGEENTDLSDIYSKPPTEFIKDGYKYKVKVKGDTFSISVDTENLHRNYSFLIIPKAIYNYYVFGESVMSTVVKNNLFFDKIGYIRKNRSNKLYIINPINKRTYEINRKVIRYFIMSINNYSQFTREFMEKFNLDVSNNIGYISRINSDNKATLLHKNKLYLQVMIDNIYQSVDRDIEYITKIFNKYINSSYFSNECNKVIKEVENMETKELNIFNY